MHHSGRVCGVCSVLHNHPQCCCQQIWLFQKLYGQKVSLPSCHIALFTVFCLPSTPDCFYFLPSHNFLINCLVMTLNHKLYTSHERRPHMVSQGENFIMSSYIQARTHPQLSHSATAILMQCPLSLSQLTNPVFDILG